MRHSDRSTVDPMEAVLMEVRRRLASGREGNFVAELGGPELGYVLYWGRLQETAPSNPPDERYYLREVRPAGIDVDGAIEWELVPYGREDVVAWNLAEAIDRTHELPIYTVVLVREELDVTQPPEFRAIFYFAVPPRSGSRMCRIDSYQSGSGSYTVQPVAWSGSAWTDDGDPISGVVNVGEIQSGEEGYLSGPTGQDVYVRLYEEDGEMFLAVHPPRMP